MDSKSSEEKMIQSISKELGVTNLLEILSTPMRRHSLFWCMHSRIGRWSENQQSYSKSTKGGKNFSGLVR